MSKRFLAVLFLAGFLSAPAFAGQCPNMMAAIDEALAANTSLSDEDKAKVMELRATGEEQHNGGDHDAAIAALGEAKSILGIE